MMSACAIMQPTFLPWLGYFDLIDASDTFVFLDDVQFDYRSWQQRNKIKSLNKELLLTVPVKGGEKKQKINEIQIDKDSNFKKKHLNSIYINYKKSRYFDEIYSNVEAIFQKDHQYLVDLNIDLIVFFCKYLNIHSTFLKSSQLDNILKKDELIVEILKKLNSKIYYTPLRSIEYLKKNIFFQKGDLKVYYQDYKLNHYKQLNDNFIDKLSVLDLLMNEGNNSKKILLSGRNFLIYDF